ncbi:9629_t:CDS:2 [Entrophospora sp. SA101]|nr:9629_t:CDS:2 [Entrophospora sp. SA101]
MVRLIIEWVESRLRDGSDNNIDNPTPGTPKQNFQMEYPPEPFFGLISSSETTTIDTIINEKINKVQSPPPNYETSTTSQLTSPSSMLLNNSIDHQFMIQLFKFHT